MTTDCIIQEIKQVGNKATETIETYEQKVNKLLDKINSYKRAFENIIELILKINNDIGNVVCNQPDSAIIISLSRETIHKLRILLGKAKGHPLYSGYKATLHELSGAVDDFEEHVSDFKFRHDEAAQAEVNDLFRNFSLSL